MKKQAETEDEHEFEALGLAKVTSVIIDLSNQEPATDDIVYPRELILKIDDHGNEIVISG